MLANKDINVTLVDMASELDTKPRATHYASTAVRELSRAGVLDDVRELGFTPSGTCWRKIDGTYLAGLQNAVVQDDPLRPTCLPLNRLGRIIYDHVLKRPTATVLWSHELIAMEQDENAARVTCKTPEGEVTFEADYVVGCDGANSKVRRLLFGDWEFPGKTWAEQIVATNVSPPSSDGLIVAGVLSLREILRCGFQFHYPSGALVHGVSDLQRWNVAGLVR
jgi:2-polyprenyl-6-methoxyphenol hydroxylase-like FAD-dependent oxidoreductase